MFLDSLPSCFSNPSALMKPAQKMPQSLVTCIYQTLICSSPSFITLTWCKSVSAHSLTINIEAFSFSISLSSPSSSFFRNKGGSKTLPDGHGRHCRRPHKLLWDFSRACFSPVSAEPVSGFYLAIIHEGRVEFLLGDLAEDLLRRCGAGPPGAAAEPTLLSRREHVFGRRRYETRASFLGSSHEIGIECSGGALRVRVDGKVGLVVRRLAWKFRGNEKIFIGGSEVEFYWDVFNWVNAGGGGGHGVFVFQVGDGGVWPEMADPEKRLMRKSCSASPSLSPSNRSVLQWSSESGEGGGSFGSSSSSPSRSSSASMASNSGFSLLLYAWKTD